MRLRLCLAACFSLGLSLSPAEELPLHCEVTVEKYVKAADETASDVKKPIHHSFVDSDRTRTFTLHLTNNSSAELTGISAKVYIIGHMLFPYNQASKPKRDEKNYIALYDSSTHASAGGLDTNYRTLALFNLKSLTVPVADPVDLPVGTVPFHVHIYANLEPIQYHGEDFDGYVIKFFQNDLLLGSISSSSDSELYTDAVTHADDEGVKRQDWN